MKKLRLKVVIALISIPFVVGVAIGSIGSQVSAAFGFIDVPAGAWFHNASLLMQDMGIMKGDDGRGTFRPDDYVKRAELAEVIRRVFVELGHISPTASVSTERATTRSSASVSSASTSSSAASVAQPATNRH